jgi:excisionase family DNA binding protein
MPRALLTEKEACEFLRISREAILKFRRDMKDPIPYLKVGRRYLYEESEVVKWAKRNARRAGKHNGATLSLNRRR